MRFLSVLFVLILITVGCGLFFTRARWEAVSPAIQLDHDFKALGRTPALQVTVGDAGTGLKHVAIHVVQKDQDVILADDSFDREGKGNNASKSRSYDVGKLLVEKFKPQSGPATLSVEATDYSLRNLFKGNRGQLDKNFEFSLNPPTVEVMDG